eukprot:m.40195 g.40195  ORF g.40195 m.40195 type:complete len:250 (+) comp11342_c0_seq2:4670-5419(+)
MAEAGVQCGETVYLFPSLFTPWLFRSAVLFVPASGVCLTIDSYRQAKRTTTMAAARGTAGEFISASQRPDGTWRKARRVRAGYVPPEEKEVYKTEGKKWAEEVARAPRAGMSESSAAAPAKQGLTKAQRKNEKRKQKRKEENVAKQLGLLPTGNTDSSASASAKPKAAPSSSSSAASSSATKSGGDGGNGHAVDATKRARNIRKKLKAIEQLQAKIDAGEVDKATMDPEQVKKLANKPSLEQELAALSL